MNLIGPSFEDAHRRFAAPAWLVALALLLLPGSARAGANVFTPTGPDGGFVRELVLHPSTPATLYAGTDGGVFRSSDGGASWILRSPTGNTDFTLALHLEPGSSERIYGSFSSGGLLKSVNGGLTWTPAANGNPSFVYSLAGPTSTPQTVYSGGEGGVYKTVDGGANWSARNVGLDASGFLARVFALAIDPQNSSRLYAGTNVRGSNPITVYRSSNGADSWEVADAGLPNSTVHAIAVHPTVSGTLYAGTETGVFRSTDFGSTWTAANTGLTDLRVRALAIDPAAPSRIYAGTSSGIFWSADGGDHWATASSGLAPPSTLSLVVHTAGSPVYAGTTGGVFRSAGGGAAWTPSSTGMNDTPITYLLRDPTNSSIVYTAVFSRGIYKSTDGGQTWVFSSNGLNAGWIISIAVDPGNPQKIYAGSFGSGFYRSLDGGGSWSQILDVPDLYVYSLAADPGGSGVVYAGTQDDGVFKTTGGATWQPVNTGLDFDLRITALAVDPRSPSIVYAGTTRRVYKTTDGGANWAPASTGLPDFQIVRDIAIDPSRPDRVLASMGTHGVFRSLDAGASWNAVNSGLPAFPLAFPLYGALDLRFDPSASGVAYVTVEAGDAGGLFRTTNAGDSWNPFRAGLPDARVYHVEVSANGRRVWAGTPTGVFVHDIAGAAFYTLTPCRVADTREAGSAPALDANVSRTFPLAGRCAIPATARSVAVNATVTAPTAPGHLTLFGEAVLPSTSTLNYRAGQTRANFGIVALDSAGALRALATQGTGTVHLILDITGYFE